VSALLLRDPTPLPDGLGLAVEDGHQTPTRGRHDGLALLTRVETCDARVHQDASPSSRPPATASPAQQRARRTHAAERRKPGAQPGHPGHPQALWAPTAAVSGLPAPCAWGHRGVAEVPLEHTPPVLA
jgi:hypothetical protein